MAKPMHKSSTPAFRRWTTRVTKRRITATPEMSVKINTTVFTRYPAGELMEKEERVATASSQQKRNKKRSHHTHHHLKE
jgi:hypothetical protein